MANDVVSGQWIRPVGTRRRTDKFFILVFPVCFLLLLGIGIFNIFYGAITPNDIWFAFKWHILMFPAHVVLTVIVFIILFVIFKALKGSSLVFLVVILIACTIFIIITCTLLLFLVNLNENSMYFIVISLLIFSNDLRNNLATLLCTKKLGLATLGPMIKKPCRAIADSFAASIISFVIVIFLLMVVYIYAMLLLYINILYLDNEYQEQKANSKKWFAWCCLFTCVLAGMCLFNFIWNFGFMVMGDYFARYYAKERVSQTFVFRGIARVSRYHLGTIGFLSIPILPSVCALIMAFKNITHHGLQNNQQPGVRSNSTLLDNLISFMSKISLILNISEYALIQTSVNGSDSIKSIRQMVNLHYNNPSLFLTLNAVLLKIVDFSMVTIMIADFFVFTHILIYILGWPMYHDMPKGTLGILSSTTDFYVIMYFVYSIIALLLRPAMCTFTIHKMTRDQHESKTSAEQTELIAK